MSLTITPERLYCIPSRHHLRLAVGFRWEIIAEAAEYDYGDAPDLSQAYKSPVQNRGDDLLDENDHYAVVYNNSVGGTYEVFRKLSEQQVQDNLTRYGLPDNATAEVKEVAAKMPEFQEKEQEEQSHGFRR